MAMLKGDKEEKRRRGGEDKEEKKRKGEGKQRKAEERKEGFRRAEVLLLFAELLYGLGSDESARNIQKWLERCGVEYLVWKMEGPKRNEACEGPPWELAGAKEGFLCCFGLIIKHIGESTAPSFIFFSCSSTFLSLSLRVT